MVDRHATIRAVTNWVTIEFRPTLEKQRDDAATKGQLARRDIFDGLLQRLDADSV